MKAGFLLQLTSCGCQRVLAFIQLACGNLHLRAVHRLAVLLYHQHFIVVQCQHRHSTRMLHHLTGSRIAVRQLHGIHLQGNDLSFKNRLRRQCLFV
ncbi:hypothetical protein D3C79_1034530 [compost metagenome]